MIGHTRDIMAALGIDLWIPKDVACQRHQPVLWRDQASEENISEIILPKAPVQLEQAAPPRKIQPEPQPKIVIDLEPSISSAEIAVIVPDELAPVLHIPAFAIEAISLAHCVLIIDATQINAEQQQLWKNIQRAVQAEFHALQWPFAWLNMQDGRGAASYVSGFLDAIAIEKNVLCLGDIPHLTSSKCIQLASLQAMLEQPLLKKRLWQFMQNTIKE